MARRSHVNSGTHVMTDEAGQYAHLNGISRPLISRRTARANMGAVQSIRTLKTEFPFAAYRFKTDGKSLFMGYEQIEGKKQKGTLLDTTIAKGQLAWDDIIGAQLKEFDYKADLAVRWHVAGADSPIVIDPQIAFGTPIVDGAPTWVIKERWEAGESIDDIAYDFRLKKNDVRKALEFEGVEAPHTTAERG